MSPDLGQEMDISFLSPDFFPFNSILFYICSFIARRAKKKDSEFLLLFLTPPLSKTYIVYPQMRYYDRLTLHIGDVKTRKSI